MAECVREGIYRIEVPLPDNPLRAVNCYFLKGEERDLLIDTGFRCDACKQALLRGLHEIGAQKERLDVLATHLHADHLGLAGEIAGKSSRIYLGKTDMEVLSGSLSGEARQMRHLQYLAAGFDEPLLAEIEKTNPASHMQLEAIDERFCPLEDGQHLLVGGYDLTFLLLPGHTPGNAMLWVPQQNLMFTGDHILFDITPNITTWFGMPDALGSYLASLGKALSYPVATALPGHRRTGDYAQRIRQLQESHQKRLQELLTIIGRLPGLSAYDLAGRMTWQIRARSWQEFPAVQKWFAAGECMAHLDHLMAEGKVARCLQRGIYRYFLS